MIEFIKKEDASLNECYYSAYLPSGLKITVIPKDFPNKFAMLCCDFGGSDLKYRTEEGVFSLPSGTAHFLEHKMFETPDGGDAFSEFDNFGGNANAFTSYESTCYYFACTENFFENLDILLKAVSQVNVSDASVEKEKKIIAREIMMYEDQPTAKVTRNLCRAMFHNHPTVMPIAGTVESISEITPDILRRAYRDFYTPENLTLCVCGRVDMDRVAALAEKYFPNMGKKRPQTLIDEEPYGIKESTCLYNSPVAAPLFSIGFKCKSPEAPSAEVFRKASAMRIAISLAFGRASDFYCTNYGCGLLSERFFAGFNQSKTSAYVVVTGSSTNPYEVLSRVKAELYKKKENFFTEEQFLREKKAAFAECLSLFDSGEDITATFATDGHLPYDEYDCVNILRSITFEEVREALLSLDIENCAISIVDSKKGE